jgi:hypothetical protein
MVGVEHDEHAGLWRAEGSRAFSLSGELEY